MTELLSLPPSQFPLSVIRRAQQQMYMTQSDLDKLPPEELLPEQQRRQVASLESCCDVINERFEEQIERMSMDSSYNLVEYLQFMITHVLRVKIMISVYEIRRGFRTIPFAELPLTIEDIHACCRVKIGSLEDFLKYVDFSDLQNKNTDLYNMFKEVIRRLAPARLETLLIYVTGACRIPATFKFALVRTGHDMPRVHSCFSMIDLYPSRYAQGFTISRDGNSLSGVELLYSDLIYLTCNGFEFEGSMDVL